MELNFKMIQSAIANDLPPKAQWTPEPDQTPPIDYSFCSELCPVLNELQQLPDDMREEAWNELLIFGGYSIEGGAAQWLCIHKTTGLVYGLDLEREANAMYLVNSCIERFIETFNTLNYYLGNGNPMPSEIETRLREIDPETYPQSEWRDFVDYVMSIRTDC